MPWSKIDKAPLVKSVRRDTPDGLWHKCKKCKHVLYQKDFAQNHLVCPQCGFHSPFPTRGRLELLLDAGSFRELDAGLESTDPLSFNDQKSYSERLEQAQERTGNSDAIVCGEGLLHEREVQIGIYDFKFMGGSMGSVVGEKIARLLLRARKQSQAAIIISASGGARMQEGLLSLMQMAKTCTALAQLREEGLPLISVMTNPTTGGVAASYAMLGDINIAEPGALIGFAGPRVIRQTIGEQLPDGFQTSEYLLEHGMLDFICPRNELRSKINQILNLLLPR